MVGLALGLVPSCVTESTGQDEQALATAPAELALDVVGDLEQQTGSVCSDGPSRCFAHVHATMEGHVQTHVAPQGFGALDLQALYNIPATPVTPTVPTIAIVDAFGYAALESDLAVYRDQYGLPACTSASGCLTIVNQTGQTSPLPGAPPTTDDWTIETALDVDMASAACPSCKLLVVQATDDTSGGLQLGQNVAAAMGATVISNSWGGPEQAGASLSDVEPYFDHPGITTFVAAGDAGYDDAGKGPDYPGTSTHVIAVGGTHVVKDTSARGYTETAWKLGGSACSLSIPRPAYQTTTGCSFKATTDIAAVGDPQTGVSVYNAKNGGWVVVGGTSAAAPLVAGIFAVTGNGGATSGEFVKNNAANLYDVTTGTNGTCTDTILCTAGAGWDGPTGYGTPNATALVAPTPPPPSGTSGSTGAGVGSGSDITTNGDVTGGCAAGGSGAGLATVLALGFVARRRRSTLTLT